VEVFEPLSTREFVNRVICTAYARYHQGEILVESLLKIVKGTAGKWK
jgi:hypothetical protein